MGTLAPLAEEPVMQEEERILKKGQTFGIGWLKKQLFHRKDNLKVLLSVMACPLSPVSVLPKQPRGVASTAEYIIQQFRATSGCGKMDKVAAKSMYAAGRVSMARKLDPNSADASTKEGTFVIWQMSPARWLFDLKFASFHVAAGSDGQVAWRRTPWFDAHAAKGGVRPLRRVLQASGWFNYFSLTFLHYIRPCGAYHRLLMLGMEMQGGTSSKTVKLLHNTVGGAPKVSSPAGRVEETI